MLHIGTTASPTIRSCLKPSSRARRADFWLSLADKIQKMNPQPFEALSWHVVVDEVSAWSRVRIGGASEALPRFPSRRLLPGRCRERAHFLSTN